MTSLQDRLDRGEIVLLDGATGTELERRGVPMDKVAWSAAANDSHASTVREVHEDYIRAGADVITTNTFASQRHVLELAGMGDQVRELNLRAVRIAQQARENSYNGRTVSIAGSMSTFYAGLERGNAPSPTQARVNYLEQAELLAEGGVDLLALEMIQDTEQGAYAVEAALKTGMPMWIGFSCKLSEDGSSLQLMRGQSLEDGLDVLLPPGGSAVTVMHTLTEHTIRVLRAVMARWSGPVGAYPHSGRFVMPNWQFHDIISPSGYLTEAQEWIQMGVQIVGGCCGIGPDHIRLLRERLPKEIPSGCREERI